MASASDTILEADGASGLSRRERKKREVRARIVDQAMLLFEQHGLGQTTVAQICERADLAQKTFFNYFPAKQDLLREVAQQSLERLLLGLEEVRRSRGSTPERLLAFFERIAANAEQAGPMHRELLTEIIHAAHGSGSEHELARRLQAAFAALIRDGRSGGDVTTRHSVQTLTEMVLGAFYALMFNWANLEDYPLRKRALATARFLSDAVAPRAEDET
jgi:AcrR family transcriptional regulator